MPADLQEDLVQRRVRVILAGGGEVWAVAVKAGTSTIPILIITSGDKSGLIASFNQPGGNISGLMTATSILEAKKFGLLCEMVPWRRGVGERLRGACCYGEAAHPTLRISGLCCRIGAFVPRTNSTAFTPVLPSVFSVPERASTRRPEAGCAYRR